MERSHLVLVADDQQNVRSPIVESLREAGFSVIEAENGADAVRLAIVHTPNAILMDVSMPVMSGLNAAVEMSRIAQLEDVPIVLMSGSPTPMLREMAWTAGCVGFLTKPFDLAAMVAEIDHWVRLGKPSANP